MTTGTWDPTAGAKSASYSLEENILKKFITFMEENANNDSIDVTTALTAEEKAEHQAIMTLPLEQWLTFSLTFSAAETIQLIRFFTLIEMQLSGWRGEEKSPVIGLAKLLKKSGQRLDKEQLVWIKSHTDNKFLPYGPL